MSLYYSMAQQSYGDQLKHAIKDKKPNDVLRVLPHLQHHDRIQCNVRQFVSSWILWFPKNIPLLHTCALLGWIAIVQLLITTYNCSPLQQDVFDNIALHYAALGGHFDIVQYFINECNIDPMSKGTDATVPLHFAACSGESLFRNLDVCMEMKLKTVKYLIEQCKCDPMARGGLWQYTTLHLAAREGDVAIVRYLINDYHCNPMVRDGLWEQTPLHHGAAGGHTAVVQYLLSIPTVDPLARDMDNETPLKTAARHGKLDIIAPIFEKFAKIRISHSVGSFVNVFLLGDPKAGKMTLTQVIKDRASSFFRFGSVKQVKSSTAGIVPTTLRNTELGNVILHDFAGQHQYYSSHTAVLENLLSNSGAVFLLLINLTEDVLKQVRFWWSVVLNESVKVSSQCHLMIVGSHVDQVTNSPQILAQLNSFVSRQVTASNIDVGGVFTLNCCRRSGNSLSTLLKELSKLCESIRSQQRLQINLSCNFLYTILDGNSSIQNIYTLSQIIDLCQQAQEKQGIPLPEDVTPLLTDLHSSGLIVYLHDNTNSWVVVHKEILLAEVDGILFAPTDFSEHCDIASNTGIVTTTALATLFPDYSLDMLISFLQFMKLCEVIDPSLLNISNLRLKEKVTIDAGSQILFFPALIHEKRPQTIPDSFTKEGNEKKLGWCLKCETGQFFSVRFLHVLLLQLAYRYALPLPDAPASLVAGLRRQCSVWINGIYWNNTDGVEIMVEQVEDNRCVIVLMSCLLGAEQDMVRLHCELVKKIVSLQRQYCPILHCTEYLIEPSQLHYHFDQPSNMTCYFMEQLISCIEEGRRAVVQEDGLSKIAITELLPIEGKKYLSLRNGPNSQEAQVCPITSVGDWVVIQVNNII